MKRTLLFLIPLMFVAGSKAQTSVRFFPLQDVRLLESPFLQAQQTDLKYLLSLSPDRLLAPFLREAGLTPRASSYTNWENTGLDGHIGGHYLSALAMMYAATGNTEIHRRLSYMLCELERAQRSAGDGFIGGTPGSRELWQAVKAGDIRAGEFDLNGKWVPLYNLHKTYAGLRDAYVHTGSEQALRMLTALTDWMAEVTAGLSDEQMQKMLRSEHGGLNETFADVAAITGNDKYLTLARRFSHRKILEPLLAGKDSLNGLHANTQIPKVAGYKRIAELSASEGGKTEDHPWNRAARFFWETVTRNRTVCIGGNSVREHFHPADDFSSMLTEVQGPETCNTYNMLRLTKMLYADRAEASMADYYERALYNHILSSQEPSRGGFVYFTPMRPGHYRVYSQADSCMWCCVGSGMENHARYGEFIYAHAPGMLLVNLFIPSRLTWREQGVVLTQQTDFPDNGIVSLHIEQAEGQSFVLRVRWPEWTSAEGFTIGVNGKTLSVKADKDGYLSIGRRWKKGDVVRIEFPMRVRTEPLHRKENHYALLYGPVVLAARTGTDDLEGLFADDSRGGHIAHGRLHPLSSAPVLKGPLADIPKRIVRTDNGKRPVFVCIGDSASGTPSVGELIPFFRLHGARYAIYFRHVDEHETDSAHLPTDEDGRKATERDDRTEDVVFPGEQQSEIDHRVRHERSDTGIGFDRRYRHAQGWFAYTMRWKETPALLRLTCHRNDGNSVCVLFDGRPLELTESLTDEAGFVTLTYLLPDLRGKQEGEVCFLPDRSPRTPALYEVRLLRPATDRPNP